MQSKLTPFPLDSIECHKQERMIYENESSIHDPLPMKIIFNLFLVLCHTAWLAYSLLVTSQTPFTYLAHVNDLNFVRRGWGKGEGKSCLARVYECVLQVRCKFPTKPLAKKEVSQMARIVDH